MTIDFDQLAIAPCMAAFGQPALFRPSAGIPVPLVGVFNRFSRDEKFDTEGNLLLVQQPTLGVRIADLIAGAPLPQRGDTVEIDGAVYEIAESVPDGIGHLAIKLKRLVP